MMVAEITLNVFLGAVALWFFITLRREWNKGRKHPKKREMGFPMSRKRGLRSA
jgi:hypothetical protein